MKQRKQEYNNFSKKKRSMKSILNRIHTSKGGGGRRYPGTECPLARKTFRSIVKISKNHRSLSQYWEECVCFARGFMQTVRVATITLSEFIVFSGLARDQEIVDGKLPPRWDGNSFGTGLVVKTSLKLDFWTVQNYIISISSSRIGKEMCKMYNADLMCYFSAIFIFQCVDDFEESYACRRWIFPLCNSIRIIRIK